MAEKEETSAAELPPNVDEYLELYRGMNFPWVILTDRELTEIPEEIFTWTHLTEVDFSGNRLKSISERLWDLPNLEVVDLTGNPIETLPDRKGLHIDLPTYMRCGDQLNPRNYTLVIGFDLTEDELSLLTPEKKNRLRNLTIGRPHFKLKHRRSLTPAIGKVLDSIVNFPSLENLTVAGFDLHILPESIAELQQLKRLILNDLGLSVLPDRIGSLALEDLSVMRNQLSELPHSFRNMKQLKHLDLSENPFTKLPECVFNLISSLEHLNIFECRVKEIPSDILRLPRLTYLSADFNPIESPPAEVVRNGLDAIRDYWRQRAETGVDYLCEAKLVILGEPGAGKTTLARKIENPGYQLRKDEKSTEGIDVIHYQFPTTIRARENGKENVLQRDFQVNIWDFGGQEIYHATHQFFLTRRSVYVLVCDDRKEDTDFSYWLQVVEMLSDASPLLIVQNEKQDRTRDINLGSLRAQFTNLHEAIRTNLETNRGLDQVVQAIRKELANLPHVGSALPATWKRVREALEHDPRDYISLEEYLKICQDHGFTRREDKLQLSGYLHDLGICLHFQDDPLLKNTVVLKPAWGTDAVYRVLDDHEVIESHGRFTRKQLNRIWFEPRYAGMQDELLHLMMKFQLCYALDHEHYIAPQRLSSDQPSYPWELTGGLVVRYEYVFLPKGIVARFIVAMHRLIARGNLVWKTGVVLERDGTRAEVVEEYAQRRIRVRVHGPDPRGLFAIVDEQLERLHASFPRLQYERYLPCPCSECERKTEPYGFPMESLIKMATKGQQIQCHESGEMIDAQRLVREILPGALRREYEPSSSIATAPSSPTPEVFVSYAWTTESDEVVSRLQQALGGHGIRLIRDREEMRYKDSIQDFMRRIGKGKAVVVVISEKYLKSESCMFEMVEIANAQSLRERVFPIVLPDANIYKATGRIQYVKYWEDEINKLDEALKTVRAANLTEVHEDLNLYSEIRRLIDGIAGTLRDMNALTPDQHENTGFDELIRRLQMQLRV